MKLKLLFVVIVFCSIFFSCDELEELLFEEVQITRSFTQTFLIEGLSEENPEMGFLRSASGGVNFSSNLKVDGIEIPKDQIKKIEISSFEYEYSNFSGNVDAKASSTFFIDIRFNQASEIYNTPDYNVAESDLFNNEYKVTGDFTEVNEFMTKTKTIEYRHSTAVSHNPARFDIKIKTTVKITVSLPTDIE